MDEGIKMEFNIEILEEVKKFNYLGVNIVDDGEVEYDDFFLRVVNKSGLMTQK